MRRIVIEVSMADHKSRSKAMKIAVGVAGVEYAAIMGPEKNLVEVVGDGIDAVILTNLIRKKVAYAEILSVGEVKEEKAAPETPAPPPVVVWPWPPTPSYNNGYWHYHPACDVRNDPPCSIL